MIHSETKQDTEMADIDLEDNNNNKERRVEDGTEVTTKDSFYDKLKAKSKMLRDLEGDKVHVLILFFLYCLQGIPLGLINAVPLILTNKGTQYTEQATFSISGYPFSMKVEQENSNIFCCTAISLVLVFP